MGEKQITPADVRTSNSRLRMFAGPNGSGKSSLIRQLAKEFSPDGVFQLNHYLNADDLLRSLQVSNLLPLKQWGVQLSTEEWLASLRSSGRLSAEAIAHADLRCDQNGLHANGAQCDSYIAAAIVDTLRETLLADRQSFSFETVMSHRSKVEFLARAQAADYQTYLYFVATEHPAINIARIENRHHLGGHDVADSKVRERYVRSLSLLSDARASATRAYFFDNSDEMVWLAEQTPDGELSLKVPSSALPNWFIQYVLGG